jgi:D-glycero-alpha-D-manno-heptose-7-phosphate kinase
MVHMVDEAVSILNGDAGDIDTFGILLNESWKIKKGLTKLITNGEIDEIYRAALDAGALGGKLLGAGGGGFILFYARPENHARIKERLKNLLYVPFQFENLGSQVIMYSTQERY